jgi:hypothetical protein
MGKSDFLQTGNDSLQAERDRSKPRNRFDEMGWSGPPTLEKLQDKQWERQTLRLI